MVKLKAKKSKGKYKSTDAWIDAIYRNNKVLIDEKLVSTATMSKKSVFKRLINELIEEGKTPTAALGIVNKSTLFTTVPERLRSNAYEALKSDKEAYKKFRELTKEHGKYTKIDLSKLVYDKATATYAYDGMIKVSFANSPYRVIVQNIYSNIFPM